MQDLDRHMGDLGQWFGWNPGGDGGAGGSEPTWEVL